MNYTSHNQELSVTSETTTSYLPESENTPFDSTDRALIKNETSTLDLVRTEDCASETSYENKINAKRLLEYRTRFNTELVKLIRESEFEFGYDNPVDSFLHDRLNENALVTKEWVNSLFVANYSDVQVATGILRVIAHFDYHEFSPQGPTIALAALTHKSLEVRECGIRTLENWGTLDCLDIIKTIKCHEEWMKNYVHQVILDLEESLNARTG